jgi:hypothetical protein
MLRDSFSNKNTSGDFTADNLKKAHDYCKNLKDNDVSLLPKKIHPCVQRAIDLCNQELVRLAKINT